MCDSILFIDIHEGRTKNKIEVKGCATAEAVGHRLPMVVAQV
jgi:hypothetical protein